MRINVFIVEVVIMFLLCGCGNKNQHRNIVSDELIAETILGKRIPIIDSLYQDNLGKRYLVLLCSPYDCKPCLDKAFNILNQINNANISNMKWVVSVLDEPSSIQRQYNYLDYIMFDSDDVIRKALKFIPTPIFLIADIDNKVLICHSPTQQDNSYEISNFLINNLILKNYEVN